MIVPYLSRVRFHASGDDSHLNSTRKLSLTPSIRGDGVTVFEESAAERPSVVGSSPLSRSRSRITRSKTASTMLASRANIGDALLWDNLSMNNVEFVERQRQSVQEQNSQNPIYCRLNRNVSELVETLNWTINHIELPFTWPTQFNDDGQEHIVFDEDKVKVSVDVDNCKMDDLGLVQLHDIVTGWIKYLRATTRDLEERQPVDFTPMAEYELWRDRETKYNTLLEQLKHPFVRQTIGNPNVPV